MFIVFDVVSCHCRSYYVVYALIGIDHMALAAILLSQIDPRVITVNNKLRQ